MFGPSTRWLSFARARGARGRRGRCVLTMLVHFTFLVFVMFGGFLAWNWPRVIWSHLLTAT